MKEYDWYFCEQCDTVCTRCDACRNISCNGGGCDKCMAVWEDVKARIEKGDHPAIDSMERIPKVNFSELM